MLYSCLYNEFGYVVFNPDDIIIIACGNHRSNGKEIVNPDSIYALPLNSIKSLCEAVMKNFVNGTDNTFEILYSAELTPCPFINVKK